MFGNTALNEETKYRKYNGLQTMHSPIDKPTLISTFHPTVGWS